MLSVTKATQSGFSIGAFILDNTRTVANQPERVDEPVYDIKQDAAFRVVSVYARRNEHMGTDGVALLDRQPALTQHCYETAKKDAVRERARTRSKAVVVSIDRGTDFSFDNASGSDANGVGKGQYAESVFRDWSAEGMLDAVEEEFAGDIVQWCRKGVIVYDNAKRELCPSLARKIVVCMMAIQMHKDIFGEKARTPNALRMRASRLRRESGLPLEIGLL